MIVEIKHSIKEKRYSSLIKCFESLFSPRLIENLSFYKHEHRFLNFSNPETFDEILHILKCTEYYNNSYVTDCADKVAVRTIIKNKGFEHILNELYCTADSPEEINWESLPDRYVVKCNHGSGYNIIVFDKATADIPSIKRKLQYWLDEDYALKTGEYHYGHMKRQILIEKYIGTDDKTLPIDYKFFCSKGDVICALIIVGRGKETQRIFVDKEYNDLKFVNEYTGKSIYDTKPDTFNEMITIAESLSREFPMVRVDLYDIDGKIIFGELTFSPHGCYHEYLSKENQRWLAQQIHM